MLSQPPIASASSTIVFSGSGLPPRSCSSAVMTATAPASMIRSCSDFAENPPNTTECVAPMRAHACIATTPSTDIGMYTSTRSPFLMPSRFSALANRHTR